MKHLWVIEMYLKSDDDWKPCEGSFWFRRGDAKDDIDDWREQNPDHRYRIAKYIREEKE